MFHRVCVLIGKVLWLTTVISVVGFLVWWTGDALGHLFSLDYSWLQSFFLGISILAGIMFLGYCMILAAADE